MNIFWLEYDEEGGPDPFKSAFSLCDRHVVNQIKESANMLAALYHGRHVPFSVTHVMHPCTLWTLEAAEHYRMHAAHAKGLCLSYTERYGKQHAYEPFVHWAQENYMDTSLYRAPVPWDRLDVSYRMPPVALGLLQFPARARLVVEGDVVATYRNYYKSCKAHFAAWRHSAPPSWWRDWPVLLEEKQ